MRWLISKLQIAEASGTELTLGFVFGTLQTSLVMLVFVLVAHLTDGLGGLLSDLGTLRGIGLFFVLWTMTCYFTLRAWMAMGINTLRRNTTMRMLTHGIIWGGFEGMAVPIFVADIILVLVTVGAIVSIEPGVILVGWFVAATVAFFGGIVGAMVGGVLGLAAAVVAIPIVLISRTLVSAR